MFSMEADVWKYDKLGAFSVCHKMHKNMCHTTDLLLTYNEWPKLLI